eukprot:365287-Chlamydomonas_euryale.AAC.11
MRSGSGRGEGLVQNVCGSGPKLGLYARGCCSSRGEHPFAQEVGLEEGKHVQVWWPGERGCIRGDKRDERDGRESTGQGGGGGRGRPRLGLMGGGGCRYIMER